MLRDFCKFAAGNQPISQRFWADDVKLVEEGRFLSEENYSSEEESQSDPKAMVPYSSFFIFSKDNP